MSVTMSLAAAFLVFRGAGAIPSGGATGLGADTVVQSFMVAFMIALVATALTRRRRRRGLAFARDGRAEVARAAIDHAVLRALVVGSAVGLGVGLPVSLLIFAGGGEWTWPGALALKTAVAIAIAVPLAPRLVRRAMFEPIGRTMQANGPR